jgi:streptogramin lyase
MPRMAVCAAAIAATALGTAPVAQAAPAVTEFAGTADLSLTGIAAGPGQRVFFTELGNPGEVGRIDTDGANLVEWAGGSAGTFSKDRKPYDITLGPDGALWMTESGSSPALARVTTAGTALEYSSGGLNGSARLAGVVTGPDGHLWAADRSGTASIVEYDPSVTTFTHYALPTSAGLPEDIAVGTDGNLWFTEPGGTGRIGRVTPTGVITEFSAGLTPNSSPWGIVAGPDGALWFTERVSPGRIGRITTAGVITEYDVAGAGNLTGIAAGTDGALWFTANAAPGAVGRITTAGAVTLHADGLTAGRAPLWIAQGPDGNMWFTENATNGAVARITVPPGVAGASAEVTSDTTATLHGAVRGNAQASSVHVEYGTTTAYGTQTADTALVPDVAPVSVNPSLEGLEPGVTYHARVVATNAAGTTAGPDVAFTTTKAASTSPDPEPIAGAPAVAPYPAMGETVVVAAVKGSVRWRTPRGRYAPVGATAAGIPAGAILDARHGKLSLASALVGGGVQKADFWGGIFQVRQARTGDGTVQLVLRGRACRRRSARASLATAARKRRHRRSLWGADDHGRYQTRGRGSVATVRGTRWYTEDRCHGTLTRVTQGKVAVRDLRRKRTVVVRAGHSYLARTAR